MTLEEVAVLVQAISYNWEQIEKEIMYEREHNYPSILGETDMRKGCVK